MNEGIRDGEMLYRKGEFFHDCKNCNIVGFDHEILTKTHAVAYELGFLPKAEDINKVKDILPMDAYLFSNPSFDGEGYYVPVTIVDVTIENGAIMKYSYNIQPDGVHYKEPEFISKVHLYYVLTLEQAKILNMDKVMKIHESFIDRITKLTIENNFAERIIANGVKMTKDEQ